MRNSSRSRRSCARTRCPANDASGGWIGLIERGCVLTRPCIRSRFWRRVSTGKRCPIRTAHRFVCRSVEIRLQVDQVDRQDFTDFGNASDHLEHAESEGVRVLFQCESERRPPALVAGDRAADRRRPVRAAHGHDDVQRIRRRSRRALRRHGSRQELLNHARFATNKRLASKGSGLAALRPAADSGHLGVLSGADEPAGPDPLITLERELGERGLQLIILTLIITPLRRLTKVSLLKFRRALGVMAFVYVFAHMLSWVLIDLRLDVGAIITEIVKRPFINDRRARLLDYDSACGDVEQLFRQETWRRPMGPESTSLPIWRPRWVLCIICSL